MSGSKNQIEVNYQAFLKILPSIITAQRGKFALMHDGEIILFLDTARDAYVVGVKFYGEGENEFSIQKVTDAVVDLGFYSRFPPW